MISKDRIIDFWKTENGKKHSSSSIEWWCIESFFKTIENNKNWNLKAVFT